MNINEIIKTIPIDREATYGGLINFASWGVKDEIDAYQTGFKHGYNCHTDETLEALDKLIK